MKIKKLLSIILAIVMTVSLCTIGQINVFASFWPIEDETLKDWMKYLPDSMPISEINMPGTHDAGTTYMVKAEEPGSCQSLSIPQQFNKGMRVLDIRVGYEEGDTTYDAIINMAVNHGGFRASVSNDFTSDYMLFKHVFEYTRNFLEVHPSETVVLYVSAEGMDTDKAKQYLYDFVHEYHYTAESAPDPDGAWLYEFVRCYLPGDGVPMLGDVRGKAVILLDNGDVENTVPPMRSLASYEMVYNLNEPDKDDKNPDNDLGGRVSRKVELVKEIFDDAVENNWKIRYDSDDCDTWPVFRTEGYKNYTNPGNPDVKYSGTNITDVYGVGSSIGSYVGINKGPEVLAEDFWELAKNENFVQYIIPGYRYGWITMDFPEMYSDFTKALIESNYAVDVFEGKVSVSDIPEVKKDDLAIDVYGCYGTPNITYSYKDGTDEVISAEIVLPTQTREHQSGDIKDCTVYVSARKNGQNYFGMLDTLSVSSSSIENDGYWYRAYGSIGMSMGTEPVTTTASVNVVFRDEPENYDLRPSTVKEISELCGDTVWEGYSSDHVKRGEFTTRPGSEISLQGNCLVSFTKNPGSDDTYTLTGRFPAYWDTAGDEYVDFCLKKIVHIPSNKRYVASVEDGGQTLVLTLVNYGSRVPYIEYDTSTGNFVKHFCKSYTQAKYSPSVWNSGWYVMDGTNSRFVTQICGDVKLILKNGADLTVNGGFNIDNGSTLTIYAQEPENGVPTGKLNALGYNGIPWSPGMSLLPGIDGSTVIHGGDINAVGGFENPGITGDLTLYGGSITAQGGSDSVGIGGGDSSSGGKFRIYGGKVNAVAGDGAERAIGDCSGTNPRCSISVVGDNTILLDNNSGEQIARPAGKTWNDALSAREVSFTASTYKAYLDYNDTVGSFERKTCTQYGMVFSNSTALTEGWYVMSKKELMLNHDITVQGNVRLIIEDDYTLTVNGSIHIEDGGSLTVYTQSIGKKMGKLNVTAVEGTAIGGNLTLYGGNMTAKGGAGAAGIGGAGSRFTVYIGRVNIIAGTGASRAVDADVTVVSGQHITLMDSSDNEPIEKPDGQDWIDILDGATVSFFGVSPEKYLEYNTDEESFDEKLCRIYQWIDSDTKTLSSGWYIARENITIDNSLTVNGDVNLILADNCILTVNEGVKVNEGNSLTVYAQSDGDNMGKLVATGSDHCAGIGGGWKHDSGLIRIHGGNITANGGDAIGNNGNYVLGGGAGIGGGEEGGAGILGEGGGVVIFGGNVTACGGAASAGIGGGYAVDQNKMVFSGEVYIYGGTVHAFGGEYNLNYGGAGIGSGACGYGDKVVINGGCVEATGGFGAAGIGGGMKGNGCYLTVIDGTVSAYGGKGASGIGSGVYGISYDDGGEFYYYGGCVSAVGNGSNTHGIGASVGGSENGVLDILCDDGDIHIFAGSDAQSLEKVTKDEYISSRDIYVNIFSHLYTSGIYKDNGDGTHSEKCLHCDLYSNPEFHTIKDFTPNNDATCVDDETETGHCSICNATYTENILNTAKGHDYELVINDYVYTYSCKNCDDSYVVDKTTLFASIEKAKKFNSKDFTEESFNNLQAAISVGEAFAHTDYVAQIDVDNAITDILTAIYALEPFLNITLSSDVAQPTISYDGFDGNARSNHSIAYGTAITLQAEIADGYEFVGWYETISQRMLSTDPLFTMAVTTNLSIEAVYRAFESASITFKNPSGQIVSTVTKSTDEWLDMADIAPILPDVPYSYGATSGRWVYDNADALSMLQAGQSIEIYCEYERNEPEFKTPFNDSDINPVANLYYSYNNESGKGSFIMNANIPDACQMVAVGIAFKYSKSETFDPSSFILTLDNKNIVSQFAVDEKEDVYIVNIDTSERKWAAVGFITYYNEDNQLVTYYTYQVNVVDNKWIV